MEFEPRRIILKDGRKCVFRSVKGSDAEEMIEYLRITSGETPYLLRNPDEVNFTLEGEEELLENKRKAPREVMILAEVDGEIAGNCGIVTNGDLRRVYHRCGLGIAIKKKYWGLGIGTVLIDTAFHLAHRMGYEQIELEVVEGNERAHNLYRKMGFEECGINVNALKYDDGTYHDEYRMVRFL